MDVQPYAPKSLAGCLVLRDLRESRGTTMAASDDEIWDAQALIGRSEGIFAVPEDAATCAGLRHLVEASWARLDDSIILFNTGSGLKYVDS